MAMLSFKTAATKSFVTAASPVYQLDAKRAAPDIILELLESDSRRISRMIGTYQWFALDFDVFTGRILSIDRVDPSHHNLQLAAAPCVRVRIRRLDEPARVQ
jgi:hypothetical protein